MVILEAASCSGAGSVSWVGFRVEKRMVGGGRIAVFGALGHPRACVRLECRRTEGSRGGVYRAGVWIATELALGRPATGRVSGRSCGVRGKFGAVEIAASSFGAVGWNGGRRKESGAVVDAASSFGVVGWNGGMRNKKMGAVVVAASLFRGRRGPSRPRVTTPRRPMQEEESWSSDEPVKTEDNRNDTFKRSVQVFSGGLEPEVPEDNAARVLQDQFNRFAAAVALADREMAEEIIREMGDGESPSTASMDFTDDESVDSIEDLEVASQLLDGSMYQLPDSMTDRNWSGQSIEESGGPVGVREIQQYVDDVAGLERQLEELYEEVSRMIDEGDEDTARELIEANYEALLEQLDMGVQGVEQAAMLDILAQLYMNMGDFESAEVLLEKTSEFLENIQGPQPLLDTVLEHVASMYSGIGKPREAIPLYIQSLDIQKSIYGKDDPLLAKTMLGLAKAYSDGEEGNKSIELYNQVLVLMERSKGQEDESLVLPLTHLGHTLLEEDRTEEAESVLQRAVMVTERAYGAGDGRVGVAMCALARAKTAQGQVDEAIQLYCQGLSMMEGCSRFSFGDPVVENVRTDLAELLNYLSRDAEAQALWEENLRVKERVLGKNDVQLVPHLSNAATSYAHSGKFEKSEPLFRRALKLMSVHYGPRAPEVSITLEMLATSLHQLGRGLEAESLARDAVSIRKSHFGEYHPSTGQAYNCLAAILHGLGKDDEAEQLLRKVLKIQERELGPECPEIILTLELLATLFNEQGRTAELQPIIRRMQKLESILNDATEYREE